MGLGFYAAYAWETVACAIDGTGAYRGNWYEVDARQVANNIASKINEGACK